MDAAVRLFEIGEGYVGGMQRRFHRCVWLRLLIAGRFLHLLWLLISDRYIGCLRVQRGRELRTTRQVWARKRLNLIVEPLKMYWRRSLQGAA